MRDPYTVLGVARTASADEIKRAYRNLAKQLHPDLNPDAPDIARRFQDVTDAYETLIDPARRAAFDRGERDARTGFSGFGGSGNRGFAEDGGFHFRRGADAGPGGDDLFEQIFGMFGQRGRRDGWPNGADGRTQGPARPEPVML